MTTTKSKKSLEETLYNDIAKTLRNTVEAAEYKHVTLPLLFLKFISDKFELQREKLLKEGKTQFIEMKEFYQKDNVFYLEEESRWSYIVKNAKSSDISIKLDTALNNIEKTNPSLKGALPDNYYSRVNLSSSKIAALIDHINNNIHIEDESFDLMGRVYEYFLQKFAVAEGKGKGEFYTPKCIVNLITEMIEPYSGKIYDPCCGSGGMFVQSLKFIEAHKGNTRNVAVYGQESVDTTYRIAKMNLALRGISGNLGLTNADTFANDQHKDLKADYIIANPPFNQGDWRAENELVNDPRWAGYDVPPVSNANYAWILNIVSKLSANGTAGFLLANGALSDSDTKNIRRRLIDNNLVEAIIVLPRETFYSTDISVTLWILSKNKQARDL
ncbi:MAG TPA: class I SAM-dependent DNA methyltransferase, partial [Patescibacteria group bacterium]|nr:class I SAM-dependent DNA methyltransferase [Patescibacteria group bacterium]